MSLSWKSGAASLLAVALAASLALVAPSAQAAGGTSGPLVAAAAPASSTPPRAPLNAGAVKMWQTDPTVWALALEKSVLYAGGGFSAARPPGTAQGSRKEVKQPALAAFKKKSGALLKSWRPKVEAGRGSGKAGVVYALAVSPDGRRLYVGGQFTHINGKPRSNLAAFNISNPTRPKLLGNKKFRYDVNGTVNALATAGETVYFGGTFTMVNQAARSRVAAVDPNGLTGFAPQLAKPYAGYATAVRSISATSQRVYVGGMFGTVNGYARPGLAVLNPSNGKFASGFTEPAIQPSSTVTTSMLHKGVLYIAGRDDVLKSTTRLEGVMAMNATTGAVLWGRDGERCLGDSFALAYLRGSVFTGSHAHDCSAIGGHPERKPRFYAALIAQRPSDGRAEFLFPQVGGEAKVPGSQNNVRALATDGKQLFVGGGWTRANGAQQSSLMRFNADAPGSRPGASFPTAQAKRNGTVKVRFSSGVDRDTARLKYELLRVGKKRPVASVRHSEVPWARVGRVLVDRNPGREGAIVRYKIRTIAGGQRIVSGQSSTVKVR